MINVPHGNFPEHRRDAAQYVPPPPADERSTVPNIELPEGVTVSGIALVFPDNFGIDDWVAFGGKLAALGQGIQFWIGDWWVHGENKYGERKAKLKAKEAFRYSLGTVMNWGSVSRSIEPSRRREVLSFTHHVEVAPYTVEEQEKWLNKAVREKLTSKALRRAVMGTSVVPGKKTGYDLGWNYAYRLEQAGLSYNTVAFAGLETGLLSHLSSGQLRGLAGKCDATAEWWTEAAVTIRGVADKVAEREKLEKGLMAQLGDQDPATVIAQVGDEKPATEPEPEPQYDDTGTENEQPAKPKRAPAGRKGAGRKGAGRKGAGRKGKGDDKHVE